MGVVEGVFVLPGLLGGGLVGSEEERAWCMDPPSPPLRLVDGGVRPSGAGLDDIIPVVGVQPDLQARHVGVVLQDPWTVQPFGEDVGLLLGGEEGAGEADAGNGGARGDHHLGVGMGGEVGAAQPIGAGIAPNAHGGPGSPGPVDQGGQQRHLG